MKRLATSLLTLTAFWACSISAEAKEVLTIYTYDSFVSEWGPGAKIKENFEKDCDCTIAWVAPGDGLALMNRLKLEGKNTKADIILGLDTSLTAEAVEQALVQKHGLDKALAKLPDAWTDEYFMPYDYAPFAIVYDTQTLKNPPKSMADLIAGDPTQKIIIEDPRMSTPGLGLLLWMKTLYGAQAGEQWHKLQPRILTVTPGWSEAYGLFTKGEAPMVFSYTTSPAYHMIAEKTERYQAASFTEGHYLQIEVAGLSATTQHSELGRKFLNFMMSPGFQDVIPTTNWMLPAGSTNHPLPPEFAKLVSPTKTLNLPSEEVAKNRRTWIEEWLAASTK